jgi:hypothetical protein
MWAARPASAFSEPASVTSANNSVSYSFRYNNATFVLLDQFDVNGNYYNSTIPQQLQWINDTLSGRPENSHPFVFVHKNILGGNHKDSMFGGNLDAVFTDTNKLDAAAGKDPGDGNGMDTSKLTPDQLAALQAKQDAANGFLASMQGNKVPYVISGHDHHHYVSLVTSPDGKSQVRQLICQSDSSKFYVPTNPVSANDAPIQQDLGRVGYYIFTVDGPRVTVDYYGDSNGGNDYGANGGTFEFAKISTISYSLNGKTALVAQGKLYAMTDDTTIAATLESGFKGTSMSLLAGTNSSVATTNYGKAINNDVHVAWAAAEPRLASDILTVNGMSRTLGSDKTDEYALSMSYASNGANPASVKNGGFGILTRDADGKWVNAITRNLAVTQKFVLGPWSADHKLGSYGVDTDTNTAWAVLNHEGDFAVGEAAQPA